MGRIVEDIAVEKPTGATVRSTGAVVKPTAAEGLAAVVGSA